MTTRNAIFYKNFHDAEPGIIASVLAERGLKLTVADVDRGEVPGIADFDIAIFGGAPHDPNTQDAGTLGQIEQIRIGLSKEMPIFGICRGFQLLTKAAGGTVVPATVPEYGMSDTSNAPLTIQLTPEGKRDPLFRGFEDDSFRVFQMHKMACDLSNVPESTLLGTGRYCRNQVAKIGSGYGIQSHIEFTLAMMKYFTSHVPDFQALGPNLMTEFERIYSKYDATTRLIVNNFLDTASV